MEQSEMENILKDINAVMGVNGSFVCDVDGQMLSSLLPENLDDDLLSPVGRTMAQTITGVELSRRRKMGELDLLYRDARVLVKNLRVGYLCILCEPTINIPLLNLTANVAAKKLASLVEEQRDQALRQAAMRKAQTARSEALNDEVRSIISATQEQGVIMRATGDTAIRLCCPSADRTAPRFSDKILDLAGRANQSGQISATLESLGYAPERRFNLLRGSERLRFTHPEKQLGVEVFLDLLRMYHQLNFTAGLDLDKDTISLADLLLWKLQYVEAEEDELRAIYTIIYDHELADSSEPQAIENGLRFALDITYAREVTGTSEPGKIDTSRILSLCAGNWGWYKTVTMNLQKTIAFAESNLGDEASVFLERTHRLLQLIEDAPKSTGWQLRARIGTSRQWYETPD
jgi:predicted regulator of Ras-like GTPase activity (Roadblock/LC7/MglB family)